MRNRTIFTGLTVTFVVFFIIPFTLIASDDEKSLEELKKMRDELKSNVEELHEEVLKKKENKNSEDSIEENKYDEIDRIRDEIQQINQSINKELEKLDRKINERQSEPDWEKEGEFEEEIEELREEIEDTRNSFHEEIEELHEDIEEAKEDIEEELEEIEKDAEEDSYAGSFVFCPRLAWLDKDPLKILKKSDGNLQGKVFDFDNNKSFMIGFMNYYNIENNFRIGSDIACGYKQYDSKPFQSVIIDAADTTKQLTVDSIITLHVIPAHIGFLCEKVFHFVKWDIFTGFMIGGGAHVVIKNNKLYKLDNIFIDGNDSDSTAHSNLSAVVAPSFVWDIHAGTAVEVAPKFHLGLDWVLNFSYAHNGFNGRTKDFVSINPAIRLRLSVGGAG